MNHQNNFAKDQESPSTLPPNSQRPNSNYQSSNNSSWQPQTNPTDNLNHAYPNPPSEFKERLLAPVEEVNSQEAGRNPLANNNRNWQNNPNPNNFNQNRNNINGFNMGNNQNQNRNHNQIRVQPNRTAGKIEIECSSCGEGNQSQTFNPYQQQNQDYPDMGSGGQNQPFDYLDCGPAGNTGNDETSSLSCKSFVVVLNEWNYMYLLEKYYVMYQHSKFRNLIIEFHSPSFHFENNQNLSL